MTTALSDLSQALKTNYIPEEPYAHLPGVQISPHGLAYIPLPDPCAEFCLTNYLTSERGIESDAGCMDRILLIPSVRDVLALFIIGGSMSVDIAKETIRKTQQNQSGWCMPVLRLTSEIRTNELPRLIGRVSLTRTGHRHADITKAQQRADEDRKKGDREVAWSIGCWLDPHFGRRGVTTIAYTYIINHFYLPYIHTFPGQLTAGNLASNVASVKLQHRLGFKTVAKSYWVYDTRVQKGLPVGDDREVWKSGCSLWQGFTGEFPVSKENSIYWDSEDWDDEPTNQANGA